MSYRYTQDLASDFSTVLGYDMNADTIEYFANFFVPTEVTNFSNYDYLRQANF